MHKLAVIALVLAASLVQPAAAQERKVLFSYDHVAGLEGLSSNLGFAVHGDVPSPWEYVTFVGAVSVNSVGADAGSLSVPGLRGFEFSATRIYAGVGPGFRYGVNDRFDLIGHVLIGYRRTNVAAGTAGFAVELGDNGVGSRIGFGGDYRLTGAWMARAALEYDGDTHLVAGLGLGF
ncbi:MAG: hypothetical protein OXH52_06115 [Gammaproteobacteria bacterium]|nr:hypothetical protein [Gammaproteobacteria bacterium]